MTPHRSREIRILHSHSPADPPRLFLIPPTLSVLSITFFWWELRAVSTRNMTELAACVSLGNIRLGREKVLIFQCRDWEDIGTWSSLYEMIYNKLETGAWWGIVFALLIIWTKRSSSSEKQFITHQSAHSHSGISSLAKLTEHFDSISHYHHGRANCK